MLTELFIKGGIIHNLNNKNALGIKNYLTSIKDKLPILLDKYFHIEDYKDFVRNITGNYNSVISGDYAESVAGNVGFQVSGRFDINVQGIFKIDAALIYLN